MKNKNILSRTIKFVYFFGCLVLISYFVASPHKAEASFFGDIWNSIVKIIDFSDKATMPRGSLDKSNSNNAAAVIDSVASSDIARAKQLSDEIFSANADPLRKLQLVNLAVEREALVKELMRKDPALFLSLAIKASQRNLLPLDIQPYIEKETTLTSKIEVIHYDDFDNPQNSRFEYFLKDIDSKTKINFYPTEPLNLASGALVKVSGFRLDNNFVSPINRRNFEVTETPVLASTGDQKTLVILLDFNNSPATHPFTKEKAYDLVFNGQFQKFYKEQSYNQVSFSGEVVDWYKLNRNDYLSTNRSAGDSCGRFEFAWSDVGQIIKDRGINLANYKRLVFMPNNQSSGGWSATGSFDYEINGQYYNFSFACVGVASFDSSSWWGEQPFEWNNFDYVMSHEMGHSLGVHHANGWDCGDKSLGNDCTHMEYGNYFDTMGSNGRALHFNAFYKEILGWIKSSQVLEINKSGTYSINTLEKDSAIKFAKISNYAQSDTPYYLEYRKAFGFDSRLKDTDVSSNQNGLFINRAIIQNNGFNNISRLIDASPTTDSWWYDTEKATLNSNATFADPDNGITIDKVSNPTDNSIDFRVTYNKPADVDLTLDKTSDGNDTVKLYAWRDIFNDYGQMVDSDFTDGETKTLRNDWHYKLVAIPDSSSDGFSGWTGCDSQTQGNSWTDADGVVHYSTPSSGEKACYVTLSDESKQIEVDFTEPSEISASPNPVNSGKSATLTWAADAGPSGCYLYSPTDNLKTIKSDAFYLGNSVSRFYHGPGYYASVGRNASGTTANLTAPTDYTLTCDIGTLNNAVSYNLKVGIASSGASGSSSSISYGDSGVDTVFNYTGASQQYIVPSGVTNVNIKASGAQGDGLGGESSAIVAVTPGETLYVNVGGQSSLKIGGWNGGGNGGTTSFGAYGIGGGGASDVRRGGTALANRIIVAGGGGGRGSNDATGFRMGGNGGIGGGGSGAVGGSGANDEPVSGGGGGGSQTSAGSAGTAGGGNGGAFGNPGATGNGGTGGVGPTGASGGGGGGGGYFGGGGGGVNYQSAGGGGGGSGYVTGARTSMKSGVRSGNGQVIITPFLPSSSSSSSSASANHTAVTNLATNIASTSATLNGTINPKGESVYYQFFYRKESDSPKSDQKTSYIFAGSGTSDVSVSAEISGLSTGTKYVYQLYAYSYTTKTMVKGDQKSFTTLTSSSSSSSSSDSSSPVSYGIAETRPYFSTGQEANDIVGVKYKFKIENNDGQNMKILFGGSRLSGTSADTYYLERNIYNSKVSYSDPVCVGGWEKLNVMTIGQSTLRIAVPDYIKKGKTGLKTGGASYFPRITYGIDNVADVTKTDVISQANLNGQEGTIETLRGDIISDKSGWKCNGQILDSDVYRQWNVKFTIGASTYQTSIALPENGAKYLTPYELINFRTEFFQNAGLFKVYLWSFQFQRESKAIWEPLTQWKVSDYDGNTANYGVRKTTYNGNNAIEISNDNSVKFFAKNETFGLLQSSSVTLSMSSLSSSSSSSSRPSSSSSSVASGLSAGLVGYWKFDETSGTIVIDSAGSNNGTLTNGPIWTAGKINNAINFDGVNDYVKLPATCAPASGNFSISMWFRPNVTFDATASDSDWLFSLADSPSANDIDIWLEGMSGRGIADGKLGFSIYNGASNVSVISTSNSWLAGEWHNVVATFSSSAGMQLFIDNVLQGTNANISRGNTQSALCYLASRWNTLATRDFNGVIDDVRIYNRALTIADIAGIYNYAGGSSSSSSSNSSSSNFLSSSSYSSSQSSSSSSAMSSVSSLSSYSSSSIADSLSKGLIAQYRFDDGNAKDSYGNNNGSIFGTVSSKGVAGNALSFNGTSSYVNVVNNSSLTPTGDMTLSAWVKFDRLSTEVGRGQKIVYKGHNVTPWESYELTMDTTNQIVFTRAGGTSSYAGAGYSGSISKGVWYHIVGVSQGSTMKIYINGTDSTSWSYNDVSGSFLQSSNMDLRIGNSPWDSGWFKGAVDEVKLYSRALTPEEVSILYSSPGLSCDGGSCAVGYRTMWLNQIGAVLESIGHTMKNIFIKNKSGK